MHRQKKTRWIIEALFKSVMEVEGLGLFVEGINNHSIDQLSQKAALISMSRRAELIAEGQSEPDVLKEFFDRWVSPRRTATIADLQLGKNASELGAEAEPELLNDAIFGAIYYRLLLRSGPLTRRFGGELIEQFIRGHRSGNARS